MFPRSKEELKTLEERIAARIQDAQARIENLRAAEAGVYSLRVIAGPNEKKVIAVSASKVRVTFCDDSLLVDSDTGLLLDYVPS